MDFSKIKTNPQKESEGVWIEGPGDSKFLVGKWMGTTHRKWIAANGGKVRAGAQAGIDVSKEADELARGAMAECILLGWENISLGDTVLEYSKENVKRLLKEVPQVYDLVFGWANEQRHFRDQDTEGK